MIQRTVTAAIVDYGLGNLFSVKHACAYVGIEAKITSYSKDLLAADLVILPGVGAYGDAMAALSKLDLVSPLREISQSGRWLVGICLGLQLLMSESYEFGVHQGLDVIQGVVTPLENLQKSNAVDGLPRQLKVPQVGWNQVFKGDKTWSETPLRDLDDGTYMYFVHSFYVQPAENEVIVSTTRYGEVEFCSSLKYNKVFACQFHPERSGVQGLKFYENIATMVKESLE